MSDKPLINAASHPVRRIDLGGRESYDFAEVSDAMSHVRVYLVRCCPSCKSLDVRRSHRRGLLETMILPLFLLRPFRCEDCRNRHYNLFFTRAFQEPAARQST